MELEKAARHGVSWFQWRAIRSPDVPDGLLEIRRHWTFDELLETHRALDALDAIAEIQRDRLG